MKRGPNVGQILMAKFLTELGIEYVTEYRFDEKRKWRFDFLLCDRPEVFTSLAIEVDGYHAGKHGKGYGSDNEKANTATMMGYRLLRFSTQDVSTGIAKAFLQKWLADSR
jgi:very-short-patch-repair endonuclease